MVPGIVIMQKKTCEPQGDHDHTRRRAIYEYRSTVTKTHLWPRIKYILVVPTLCKIEAQQHLPEGYGYGYG